MANIEQLNFSLIINESEFDEQIKRVKDKADELNTSITNILGANKKIVPFSDADVKNVENVAKAFKEVAKAEGLAAREAAKTNSRKRTEDAKAEAAAIKEAAKARGVEERETIKTMTAQERLNRLQKEHTSMLGRSSRLWREMGSMMMAYFSIRGAASLIKTLTNVTAEFEMQRITLGAILQDTQEANKIFGQLKELAVMSPFQFKDLATYAKQLSAFSIPVEELYDTTKMLADVSAGLGVGMDRLVLAYGQIRSASFLRGQEVRQLTEAGIPILEELRKQFVELGEEGITVGDVFDKISKRLVPFEMVEKVFKDMTEEGGKFYKMQEVQADTLKGKISNLTDAYQIMFSEIGDKKQGLLKGAVDMARALAENYERVGRIIASLVAVYGAYRGALVAVRVLENAVTLQMRAHASAGASLAKAIQVAVRETNAYKVVMHAIRNINPYVAIGSAIVGVTTALLLANEQAKKFKRELNNISESQYRTAQQSVDQFKSLVQQLKNATQGSQDYRDAISKLNNQYGEYLPNLLNEQNALTEIIRLEGEATNAILARGRAYATVEGQRKIEDKQGKKVDKALLKIQEGLEESGLWDGAVKGIMDNFKSAIEKNRDGNAWDILQEEARKYITDQDRYEAWVDAINKDHAKLRQGAVDYAKAQDKLNEKYEEYNDLLELRWVKRGYSTEEEERRIGHLQQYYDYEIEFIKKRQLSAAETEEELKKNEIARLEAIKKAYQEMNDEAAAQGVAGAWNNQLSEIEEKLRALGGGEKSWIQNIVAPFATGANKDLMADLSEGLTEYAERMRKEYKAVTGELEDATDAYDNLLKKQELGESIDAKALKKSEDLRKSLEGRKTAIENIGGAVGFSIDDKIKKTSGSGSTGKSKQQTELETRRDTLKDIYKWYQKMTEAGMDEGSIQRLLTKYFPDQADIIAGQKYRDVLISIANALGEYDDKAAQALRDDVQATLEEMAADGTLAKISEEWFGADVTIIGK